MNQQSDRDDACDKNSEPGIFGGIRDEHQPKHAEQAEQKQESHDSLIDEAIQQWIQDIRVWLIETRFQNAAPRFEERRCGVK